MVYKVKDRWLVCLPANVVDSEDKKPNNQAEISFEMIKSGKKSWSVKKALWLQWHAGSGT